MAADNSLPISFFSASWVTRPEDNRATMYFSEEDTLGILRRFSTYSEKDKETWAYILRESNNRLSLVYNYRNLIKEYLTIGLEESIPEVSGVLKDIIDLRVKKGVLGYNLIHPKSKKDYLNDIRYKNIKHFYRKIKKFLCTDIENLPIKLNEKDPILLEVVRLRLM